jgi:tetratricopeptide (TPR) repeat protein
VADLEKLVQKVLGTEIAPNNWEQLPYYQALATIKRYSNSERLLLRAIANLEPSARLRTSPKFIGVQVRLYLALFALTHNSKWQTRAFNSLAGQIDVSADPDLAIAASLAYLSQENDNEAARIIEEALRRSPHQPDLLATAAKLDLRRGAIMEALKRLREVATVNPLDADIFTNLGAAYLGIPDPKNAVKELQRAYELNPSPRALSNLGAAYLYSGNFGAAEPILERAVDMDPTGGATCNLGQALWGLGRRDLALSVLEHASRRDATELTSGCLAHVYRWAGQSELAKQEFLTAIRLARNTLNQSNDPVLRGRLATYEAGIGSRQALIDIRRARGLRLADLDLLIKNAIVLQMLGDKQAATSLVDEIVRRGGREIIENHPDLSMLSSPQH